ncbi:MAG: MBL fold metallo-hydrolase [Anaerolineae bacterium]|nr:MAG: MBL fold metallo-hydrolase [Anaerolineae bacterium]
MDITWYGHACFRLYQRGASVVIDPYEKSIGYDLPRLRADIVTISHDHPGHRNTGPVRNKKLVISGPGEYEVRDVFITGIATFHDGKKGSARGRNTVYLYDFDGLKICHLGDLGHVPLQAQVEVLNSVDVLLIPVGGVSTINAAQAAEVVSLMEPGLVVPMHYRLPSLAFKLDPVSKFLKAMGLDKVSPQETLSVTKSGLPEETQVVLLEPQSG